MNKQMRGMNRQMQGTNIQTRGGQMQQTQQQTQQIQQQPQQRQSIAKHIVFYDVQDKYTQQFMSELHKISDLEDMFVKIDKLQQKIPARFSGFETPIVILNGNPNVISGMNTIQWILQTIRDAPVQQSKPRPQRQQTVINPVTKLDENEIAFKKEGISFFDFSTSMSQGFSEIGECDGKKLTEMEGGDCILNDYFCGIDEQMQSMADDPLARQDNNKTKVNSTSIEQMIKMRSAQTNELRKQLPQNQLPPTMRVGTETDKNPVNQRQSPITYNQITQQIYHPRN